MSKEYKRLLVQNPTHSLLKVQATKHNLTILKYLELLAIKMQNHKLEDL